MARNNLASEDRLLIWELEELKRLVRRLKKAPKTNRSLQLLFWYKKGERSSRLLRLMKDYVSKL